MLIGCMRVSKAGDANGARRGGRRHECLRRATAVAHRALEAMLEDAGCFASVDGYWRYLRAVAPLYATLETTLDAANAARWLPDWPCRRKRALILAGLREGATADQPSPDAALRIDWASAWNAGDIFGALYVLEGATLGGALLARKLRALGVLVSEAACLLDPYGPERGAMWRAFLERLEAVDLTDPQEEALYARAVETFSLFAAIGESLMGREASR